MPKKLRSIELFTGAGGLALATHAAGFSHSGLFEWNDDACDTIRSNAKNRAVPGIFEWRNLVTEGDVRNVQFSEFDGIDLVAGGPPCQPFSLGGKHGGMEDSRDMIPQFIRAVRQARPRAFIMENVRGLARRSFAQYLNFTVLQLTYPELVRKKGEAWESHLARLHRHHTSTGVDPGLAYNVIYSVKNAANFGAPQCRERIFIVGFRNDVNAGWSFPLETHSQAQLLREQWVTRSYWHRHNIKQRDIPAAPSRVVSVPENELKLAPWVTVRDAIADLPPPFKDKDGSADVLNHRLQPGAKPYPGHTGSPYDWPSKTLKAGDHGVPGGENMIAFRDGTCRYFTVREAARIQTFPDHWQFKGAWSEAMRQLGNAVPVVLAEAIANSVAAQLSKS